MLDSICYGLPEKLLLVIFLDIIMVSTVAFVSIVYISIGLGINKTNARYLLSGYNTMSQAKRDAFDIDRYLEFFKSFFKRLGLFPPVSWFVCVLIFDSVASVTVWAVMQCLPMFLFLKISLSTDWSR
jgi:hypothetical protein